MNLNSIKKSYFIFVLLVSLSMPGTAFCSHTYNVEVNANVDNSKNGLLLNIKLTNNDDRSISMYQHDLPWISTHKMILILVDMSDHGKIINQLVPFDDQGDTIVDIGPGKTLEGKIMLRDFFPMVDDAKQNGHELIIFWTYQCKLTNEDSESKRFGGWINLSAQ